MTTETPRTDEAWEAAIEEVPANVLWSAVATDMRSLAGELERENARLLERVSELEKINKNDCEDWARDHTHLQNLCRKAGYDEHAVEGDSYGIRSIEELGDMLLAKIELPNA